MKRPNITAGPWTVRQADCVYSDSKGRFICDCERTPCARRPAPPDARDGSNARAIAALPDLLAALEGLLQDKYLADPINADRMKRAREALIKAGYTFDQ